MKLLKLSSNKKSFNEVKFNPSGLTFIVGQKVNPDSKDRDRTYNGIGKSLIVYLIHYCLGASTTPYKQFIDVLPDWDFILEFNVNDKHYISRRSNSDPGNIILNGKTMSISDFTTKIETLAFDIPKKIGYLSFRALLPFFIRYNRAAYTSFDAPSKAKSIYQTGLYNGFLLGIDPILYASRLKLINDLKDVKKLKRNIEKDPLLQGFFGGGKNMDIKIDELEEEIEKLRHDIHNLKVADDYDNMKDKENNLVERLSAKKNDIEILKRKIANIEKSIQKPADLDAREMERIYNETQVYFPDALRTSLSEVDKFMSTLLKNRKSRLQSQKKDHITNLSEEKQKYKALKNELDGILQYLNVHQALDVLMNIKDRCSELEIEREKLLQYRELLNSYDKKKSVFDQELIEGVQQAREYLIENEKNFSLKSKYFRSLAKRFYPSSTAGLTINVLEGDNQLQFRIDAKIESDGSDGINNVKIFCYDTTLLFKGENHEIDFIFHDNRIFDGVDERQKADMFEIAFETFHGSDHQYIATLNQNQIAEVESVLGKDKTAKIIHNNTVLELTDETDEGKLLGVKKDFKISE